MKNEGKGAVEEIITMPDAIENIAWYAKGIVENLPGERRDRADSSNAV